LRPVPMLAISAENARGNTTTPDVAAAFDASAEFERILAGRLPKLHRIAFRYLDNPEDAQDAVQDALLSAFRHASQFQQRAQLSTWLHRIVINSALVKLRARRRHETTSLEESSEANGEPLAAKLVSPAASPEQLCAQTEIREIISAVVRRLPPKQRRACELCAQQDWPMREAARELGVGVGALKCSLVRARRALRDPLRRRLRPASAQAGVSRSRVVAGTRTTV